MSSRSKAFPKLIMFAVMLILAFSGTISAQDAKIDTARLDHLAAKARETIDVNIDENLLRLATKFLSNEDVDEAAVKELVDGLKGVYVKSFEFDAEDQYSVADIESIRSQLKGSAWNRIFNAKSLKDGNAELYLMTQNGKVSGLALLRIEPKEITVVNIVGPVDLDKLSDLEGKFGIPDLDLKTAKPKRKPRK